jgi:hypothetical protein
VLQDWDETLLALQASDKLGHRVQTGQWMQRTAMVARRQIRRTRHGKGRCGQHSLWRHPGPQFFQCTIEDFSRRGFLDELDQRFDGAGKLDTIWHGELSRYSFSDDLALVGLAQSLADEGQHEVFRDRHTRCGVCQRLGKSDLEMPEDQTIVV